MCVNKINSDNSEQKYVHLSNGLIQSYEIVTCLKYEYVQVTEDLLFMKISHFTGPLFGDGMHSCFANFLVS